MIFYLKRTASGRVYLSQIKPVKEEDVIKEIDAEKWIKAREKINSDFYEHREGHGFLA